VEEGGTEMMDKSEMMDYPKAALKFCKGKPLVKVYGRIHEGYAEISIEDNGIDFDEGNLDRIFHPFQRLHGRSKYEGVHAPYYVLYLISLVDINIL
jgi:light-regulated signal transduction histidine kinase (bacteriophytochrome)